MRTSCFPDILKQMRKAKKKNAPIRKHRVFQHAPLLIPSFFLAFVAVVYAHNLTHDIYSGDIGDLVTASYVFGVAHPPGYPLFTFLGFLLSHMPIPVPVVTKVALISFFSSLTSLILYYRFAYKISRNIFLSLLPTAILAFSYLFWFHTEIPEAFGLNNLFAVLLLYCSYQFLTEKSTKYLYLLAFIGGLSLTHHQTILFLFPGIGIMLCKHFKFVFLHPKRLITAGVAFFAGLLPYIYVPIAAHMNPVISWDSATNLTNFIHLVLRKDYGFAPSVVNEVPISVKLIHVKSFLTALLNNYSSQIIILTLGSAIVLVKRNIWFFTGLTLCFILTGPFFMYYAAGLTGVPVGMGIIERFYVLPSVIMMFYVPFGLSALHDWLQKRFSRPVFGYALISYFLIIPVLLFVYNFPKTDLSRTKIGNTLADNIFSYLPENSVLFVSGDTTTFNLWYNHYVLSKRSDIGLINPPGVGGNAYFDDEINAYYRSHPQAKLTDLPAETIRSLQQKKRIFSTYPIDLAPRDTVMLPWGLVYEMTPRAAIPDKQTYYQEVEAKLRRLRMIRKDALPPSESNLVAAEIPGIYASGLVRIGDFMDSYYHDPVLAEHYYRRALWLDPEHPNAYSGLALVQYKSQKDCRMAPENMKTAIALYPVWKTYYLQLYLIYLGCNAPQQTLDALDNEYKTLFHEDLKELLPKNVRPR